MDHYPYSCSPPRENHWTDWLIVGAIALGGWALIIFVFWLISLSVQP